MKTNKRESTKTVDIPDFDTPFFGASKRVVFPTSRSACNMRIKVYPLTSCLLLQIDGTAKRPPLLGYFENPGSWGLVLIVDTRRSDEMCTVLRQEPLNSL